MPTRRRLIGALGAITGLAGCASRGGSSGGIQPQPRDVVYDTDTVSEGNYLSWTFSTDQTRFLTVTFAVQSGPDVDVFVMSADAFDRYETGNEFEAYAAAASAGTEFSVNLPAGDHVAVVDNTERSSMSPSEGESARVEINVTLQ
jgi:hypothetical protein